MSAPDTGHLADNVRTLREARGLSQQQIAKLAAVPRATWTNLESGTANPTLAVLVKVAGALQVHPIVAQLLINRSVSDPGLARRFLDAPLNGLHAPELLPGVSEAAARLLDAVRQGRRVCV